MLSPSLNKDFTYLLKTIKIMSILKSIWSDSLAVSSQFEKDHPTWIKSLGGRHFYDCPMYAFFLSQSCSYILYHLLIIFTSFHLDIQY